MIDAPTPAEAALRDARALLHTLTRTPLAELHLASGDMEVFIAKPAGRANPMRATPFPAGAAVTAEVATSAAVVPVAEVVVLRAPHVASVAWLAPEGAELQAGATAVELRVLDTVEALAAPSAGRVGAHRAAVGELIDYGSPVLELR